MLEPNRIKCRKLKRLFESGEEKGIRAEWLGRVKRILAALHSMTSPAELDLPGFKWHRMTGDRKGVYAVLVSKNWRITYRWSDEGPFDVDLEDYHGK